jgi:hypothetical protein
MENLAIPIESWNGMTFKVNIQGYLLSLALIKQQEN